MSTTRSIPRIVRGASLRGPATRLRRPLAAVTNAPRPLVALLGVAFVLAIAWGIALAPFQGPDESDHFAYAQHLAETGKPPSVTTGTKPVSSEENTALSYLNLLPLRGITTLREAWTPAEQAEYKRREAALPPSARDDGAGPNPLAKNPPLYYAYEAVPYRVFSFGGLFTRMTMMRWASGMLLVVAVLFAWLLAGEVFRKRRFPQVMTAGVVALHPGLVAETGAINADVGLACVWTVWLYAAVLLVRRGPSPWRLIAVLALAAASVLVHGRGLAIVPATLIALVVMVVRHRPPARAVAVWTAAGVVPAAVMLAIYRLVLTPAGSGGSLYGGEAHLGRTFQLKTFIAQVWDFYLPPLAFLPDRLGPPYGFRQMFVETFFSSFASLEVVFPTWTLDLLQIFLVAVTIGAYLAAVARRGVVRRSWEVALVLAGAGVCLIGFLHVASYRALANGPPDPLIVGRYLFPGVALLGILVAFVAWALPRRAGAVFGAAVLAAGVALQFAALGLTLSRFYG